MAYWPRPPILAIPTFHPLEQYHHHSQELVERLELQVQGAVQRAVEHAALHQENPPKGNDFQQGNL